MSCRKPSSCINRISPAEPAGYIERSSCGQFRIHCISILVVIFWVIIGLSKAINHLGFPIKLISGIRTLWGVYCRWGSPLKIMNSRMVCAASSNIFIFVWRTNFACSHTTFAAAESNLRLSAPQFILLGSVGNRDCPCPILQKARKRNPSA